MANERLVKIDEKIQALNARKKQIKAKENAKKKKQRDRQKTILGDWLIKKAKSDEKTRQWLLNAIDTEVTKAADKKALEPLTQALKMLNPSIADESTKEVPVGTFTDNRRAAMFRKQ